MWGRVIGGAVALGLASLLIWAFGNSRYGAGELSERVKWQKEVATLVVEKHRLELALANRVTEATTVYVDRVTKLQPIIQKSKETVREYAKTAEGASACLPLERVLGVEQDRRKLFPDYTPAPEGYVVALRPIHFAEPGLVQSGR